MFKTLEIRIYNSRLNDCNIQSGRCLEFRILKFGLPCLFINKGGGTIGAEMLPAQRPAAIVGGLALFSLNYFYVGNVLLSPSHNSQAKLVDCVRGTIGAGMLNFRVRNENGCDHSAKVTDIKKVKRRELPHLR